MMETTIDYKQEIINMINDMENLDFIFKIYHYILAKYRRSKENEC